MSASPLRPPVVASQVPDEWCALVREVVRHDKHGLRAGDYLVSPKEEKPPRYAYTIEVQSIAPPKRWAPLGLPSGSHFFASAADRDIVLKKIQSGTRPPAG